MRNERALRLRKETLTELDRVELRAAAAGAYGEIVVRITRICEDTSEVTSRAGMTCLSTQPSCLTCDC